MPELDPTKRRLTWTVYATPLMTLTTDFDRKNPPPPGGFPIYYVPSSRTVSKRTPLEAPFTNSWSWVLLLTVLDEGT